MSEYLGEALGTMLLIILGGGVVGGVVLNKTKSFNAGWLTIAVGWGLAVSVAIYAVGGISGAHINPAVTLALAAIGEFSWELVPGYIAAQLAGAFLGAVIVFFHYLPHWKVTPDQTVKLSVFSTDPAIRNNLSNLLSEIIGTFILMMGILAIGANEFSQGLNPLVIGLLILSIGVSLGGTTGYAINPARDLGPRIAHFLLPIPGKGASNWSYAWIPVVGPVLGGVYGGFFYKAVFHAEIAIGFWVMSGLIAAIMFMAYLGDKKENDEMMDAE